MSAARIAGRCAGQFAVVAALAVVAVADPVGRDWPGADLVWRDDPRPPADAPYGVDPPPSRGPTRRAQRRAAASRRRGGVDITDLEQPLARPPSAPPGSMRLDDGPALPWPGSSDVILPTIEVRVPPDVCPVPGPPAGVVPPPWDQPTAGIERVSEVVTPAATAATVVSHRDQPYAVAAEGTASTQVVHGRQRFDLHRPGGCSAGGMPLVVWIHGDSWREGSKADCPIIWMADEGYVVASIGYRLSDAAVFPAQLDDCRAAIEQIVRDADVWGIDPTRVAVAGSGGGGHLAALVGLLREPGLTAMADPAAVGPRIAAVCAVAAPANLITLGPEHDRAGSAASRLVGGPLPEFREKAQRASPISHVSNDDPPVLLIHGAADATVRPRQATEFDQALRGAGVDSTLVILPGAGHRPALGRGTPAGQSLLMFLDRTLGAGVRTAPPAAAPEVSGP